MPDAFITDTTETRRVKVITLENLRDVLRARADHLSDWTDEVGRPAIPTAFAHLIAELERDLDEWARILTDLIGDDA